MNIFSKSEDVRSSNLGNQKIGSQLILSFLEIIHIGGVCHVSYFFNKAFMDFLLNDILTLFVSAKYIDMV